MRPIESPPKCPADALLYELRVGYLRKPKRSVMEQIVSASRPLLMSELRPGWVKRGTKADWGMRTILRDLVSTGLVHAVFPDGAAGPARYRINSWEKGLIEEVLERLAATTPESPPPPEPELSSHPEGR